MTTMLSGAEAEEYVGLYAEYAAATEKAFQVLRSHGMSSVEFADADAEIGVIWKRLRALQGLSDAGWMA